MLFGCSFGETVPQGSLGKARVILSLLYVVVCHFMFNCTIVGPNEFLVLLNLARIPVETRYIGSPCLSPELSHVITFEAGFSQILPRI